jgi:DNA-binding NtrC family response regulator
LRAAQHVQKGLILIVDDEEQILKVCSREVLRLGYEVVAASSGKQAIEILSRIGRSISLVILDMTMPEMSGNEVYDAIQKLAPGTKVLLCSGYSSDGQAKDMLARGCNGFLQKPFDLATLAAKISELIAPRVGENSETNGANSLKSPPSRA